jgi:hypothetical protein
MAKPRMAARAAQKNPKPPSVDDDEWVRWTVQLPEPVIWKLKVRAAQEQQNIRETLRAAIEAYCEAPVDRAG